MGTARNSSIMHGVVIHDDRITESTQVSTSHATYPSSYTQHSPIADVPEPSGDYDMALEASDGGSVIQDASLSIQTQRAGNPRPEGAGFIWRSLRNGDSTSEYKGWDSFSAITGGLPVKMQLSGNDPDLQVCRLQSGKLLAVGIVNTSNVPLVYEYTIASASWSLAATLTGHTASSGVQLAILQLPSERVLCFMVTTSKRQVDVLYSDDDGSTWSDYAEAVLDEPLVDEHGSTITPRRMSVAYSNGQILLLVDYEDTTDSNYTVAHYASDDMGTTFTRVAIDDQPASAVYISHPTAIGIPGGGINVTCLAQTDTLFTAQPAVYRLGSAYQAFSAATSTTLDTHTPGAFVDPDEWPIFGWLDEDQILYILTGEPDGTTRVIYRFYRSPDYGITAEEQTAASWIWGGTGGVGNRIYGGDVASVAGKAQLVTRYQSGATYDVESVVAIELGAYGAHTLPDSYGDTDYAFKERNQLTWGEDIGAATPTPNEARLYLPIDLPNSIDWTLSTGGGTVAVDSSFRLSMSTSAAAHYWTATSTSERTSFDSVMAQFDLHIPAGNGSTAADDIAVKLRLGDASAYEYEVSIRLADTGIGIYDTIAASTLTAPSPQPDLTTPHKIRVAMLRTSAGCSLRIWTAALGHALEWTAVGSWTLTNAGTPANEFRIQWGHIATATADSYWRLFAYSRLPADWTPRSLTFADGWTNPDSLHPRSYSTLPVEVAHGLKISAKGGPTRIGETWQVDAGYKYPLSAIYPTSTPSPRRVWRSVDTSSAVHIVWDTESLYTDGIPDNDTWAIWLLSANFRTAYLEGWTGAAWTTLATLDAADGFTGLAFDRKGRKLRPSQTSSSHGKRWLYYEDHVGDTVDLGAIGGGDPPGSRYVKIVHNTEGAWADDASAKTKHPTIWLDADDLDGGEVASGTAAIWRRNFGTIISGFSRTNAYDVYRLRIPSQSTADGYFQIGTLVFGDVALLGRAYDLGWSWKAEHPAEITDLADGGMAVAQTGPERRVFTCAWATTIMDQTSVAANSPDPDYMAVNTAADLPSGTAHDTARVFEGIARRTHGPRDPVLFLQRIDLQASSPGSQLEARSRAFLWGRIMTDPTVVAVHGDELSDEAEQVQQVQIVEVV